MSENKRIHSHVYLNVSQVIKAARALTGVPYVFGGGSRRYKRRKDQNIAARRDRA